MPNFFSTGSTMLNLALGGGWCQGRIFNIVGDKSTGKTLLAIEAFANFSFLKDARMRYAEAEAAFDDDYAKELGFPSNVTKPEEPLITVERFNDDLEDFADKGTKLTPSLYILDSLDALSDSAEMDRSLTDATFGANKAKQMSAIFRKGLVKKLEDKNCTLGIISQIRDRMDVSYGESKTRAGGRALDFYASQVLWLAEIGKEVREVKGQKRPYAVDVKGKVKKLKVGIPFREVDFQILFGYGVDDEMSMLDFLQSCGEIDAKKAKELKAAVSNLRKHKDYEGLKSYRTGLIAQVTTLWNEIENKVKPEVKKYM